MHPESRWATLSGLVFAFVLATIPLGEFWRHRAALEYPVSWAAIGLNTLAFLAAGVISVVMHEAAHALVARAVRLHIVSATVGVGPVVWSWFNGETDLELRVVPFGGQVIVAAPSWRWLRARLAAVSLAGPLAHVVLFLPLLRIWPDGRICLERFYCHPHPKDAFFLTNVLLAIGSLIPIPPTDGWRFLSLPFRSKRFLSEYVAGYGAMKALGLMWSGRLAEAKTLIDEVLAQYPLSEVALCVQESADRIAE